MADEGQTTPEYVAIKDFRKKKAKRKPKPKLLFNTEETQSEDDATAMAPEDESPKVPLEESPAVKMVAVDGFGQVHQISPSPTDKEELLEQSQTQDQEPEEYFQSQFNENALSRFAETYQLEKFKKNALIIFNQEEVEDEPIRHGTQTDVDALMNTFEKFGFEVRQNIHNDLTKDEIFDKMKEFIKRDYTEYGCVGVCILTHGSHYGRLRAKDKVYNEIDIINQLKVRNKPTLVTKPKFLFIQACRGTKIRPAIPVLAPYGALRTDTGSDVEPYHLPEEADILILHSSYIGSPAIRDEVRGSWFIQSLCKTIDQLAHKLDLESIITEVKRIVAIDRYYMEQGTLPVAMGQMPVKTSTLIRRLYLKKYGDPPTPPLHTISVMPTAGPAALTTRKDSQVIEMTVTTPILPQFGPCSCFLDHFNYMRDCMKHYVADNPDDTKGKLCLELANDFKEEEFSRKQTMLRIFNEHLKIGAKDSDYFKYLYLYNK